MKRSAVSALATVRKFFYQGGRMNATKNAPSISATLFTACLAMFAMPAPGQQLDQGAKVDRGKKQAIDEQSLERALRELSSLSDQLREARQQQADERVAAERAIATLESENKELAREQARNAGRIATLESALREWGGAKRPPLPDETLRNMDLLHKAVVELRHIFDRSLPQKSGEKPSASGRRQTRAHGSDERSEP